MVLSLNERGVNFYMMSSKGKNSTHCQDKDYYSLSWVVFRITVETALSVSKEVFPERLNRVMKTDPV